MQNRNRKPCELQNAFEYNGFGLRAEKTDSLGTASFLTDGLTVASPVMNDGSAVYTYGPGLVSERRNNATSAYHLDGLGSTRLMTNAGQSITASLTYDAFGNALSGSAAAPFKYAGSWGYQTDADSGLMLLGHRYYDASTGRFLSLDPVKDGDNWYGYVENNPLSFVDPFGLEGWGATIGGAVGGTAGAGATGGNPLGAIGGGVGGAMIGGEAGRRFGGWLYEQLGF